MTLRQKFLEYAQQSLDEDLDLSWMPLEQCGWFFWVDFPSNNVWQSRQIVIELLNEGLIERHPDHKHYMRIKC